jgi:sulfur-oxidizing protein SoxZ
MTSPMRIRARMAGDVADVRVLMAHEMETGTRKGSDGQLVPAWFIQEVTALHNGKNPYLQFKVKGAKAGDKVAVTWKDNKGESRTDEAAIA